MVMVVFIKVISLETSSTTLCMSTGAGLVCIWMLWHSVRCSECAIATGIWRQHRLPLKSIPAQRPFQTIGMDGMDLLCTEQGNKHVIELEDMSTKWPMVFTAPDQKVERIANLIGEIVVPMISVSDSLLTDQGTNLRSNVVCDICAMLGIQKLNSMAYHPACDDMVCTIWNTMGQISFWCLMGLPKYPHESIGKKTFLFGLNCRLPMKAVFLPVEKVIPTSMAD